MAYHYLMKFKGRFRVLAELDKVTHDYPRDEYGQICDEFDDLYLACRNGNRVYTYGHKHEKERTMWLIAYIPSIQRARNVLEFMNKIGISYSTYIEGDGEATFHFKAKDIDKLADILEIKTKGAGIGPFSVDNYPKSNVCIPQGKMAEYKAISDRVKKEDKLQIAKITNQFLDEKLTVALLNKDKTFNRKADMCKHCLRRQPKEYIYFKGFWDEYIQYLREGLSAYGDT